MSLGFVGQRCLSEREPELGLGQVAELEHARITIEFPATRERRIYARGTPVLKRVQFAPGETVATRAGVTFTIEEVAEEAGLLVYIGGGQRAREDNISDLTSVSSPAERLMAGQAEPSEVFDLRQRTLRARTRFLQSDVRGFLGGRIDLIPHQFYILHEVSNRQLPRVLLSDEVGLGKTIEACLILQRLLATGRASRALILVPESLVHQWFVELLRRFNLWFTLFDEPRCLDTEAAEPGKNPFLSAQLGLAAVSFLAGNETRRDQAVAAGWDLVIVDEAHHLGWTPEAASPDYQLVEQLAKKSPGLLLLTATPTQLGLAGHFARLRLLDPNRYADYETFVNESADYGAVAGIAEKIVEQKPLAPKDHAELRRIFDRDPETLATRLAARDAGKPGARDALLRTLLDQHGTGRVVFRNTRAAMSGFPKRKYQPVALPDATPTLHARIARELHAEETGETASIRYAYKDDPRIDWLVAFLQKTAPAKVLLICRSERKVLAIEAAIKDRLNLNIGLFHEGLPLVQRDRQAAWFAEPAGAQILLCSEIGSEGRNFQFAHHLVLFDLPLNPGLVEQRIGRLDRIGQTDTIKIHVPVMAGGADAVVAEWYHRGLDAFEAPLHGGNDYAAAFRDRLLDLAVATGEGKLKAKAATQLEAFVSETAKFRDTLQTKLKKGRDRLLELNSFNPTVAAQVIERVRAADADPLVRRTLADLLDHYGVRVKDLEDGELHLDAEHAYVEGFPSIPRDGMLATYDRAKAIVREDVRFLSADHPLVRDSIDLLIDSPAGTTAFCVLEADKPNLLLEAVFVLETVADAKWHVDQFLAPTPVRVLVDIHGSDLTESPDYEDLDDDVEDAPLPRFLAKPGFNGTLLKNLVEGATDRAKALAEPIKQSARERAAETLTADLQRLVELGKLNDNVRPEEIDLAKKKVRQTRTAIEQARLRLDSLRLIVEGVEVD
ncbi:MAG: RNA polymerase-associated protein RapA [Verrucomicrobiota bacterium]